MESLRNDHQPLPLCSDDAIRIRNEADESKKKLVILYHDESIYNTNGGQKWMWEEEEHPALLPKTKGSGIMISDFVGEHDGFLRLTDEQFTHARRVNPEICQCARIQFEYGVERDGYWTGDKFNKHMEMACTIAEYKYPSDSHTVVFVLDQSSCHTKYAPLALFAKNILKKDGGERRVRDTIWCHQVQSMVYPDGTAKGLQTILTERGITVGSILADDLRTILSNHQDFKEEKTQVEHTVARWNMKCLFIPKFHCELNPIERVWGQSKVYARAHTNFTLVKLRKLLDPALDSVSVDLIRKYFRKARDYEQAYREGHKAGKAVEKAVKRYKSHRRVPVEDL